MSSLSRRHVLAGGAALAGAAALSSHASAHAAPSPSLSGPAAKVTGGVVRGTVDANGVRSYKGIPYAASTAGENRWRAPQPVTPWKGVRAAAEFGPIAVQNVATGPFGPWTWEYLDTFMSLENGLMSEDCLRVNVWTRATPNSGLPVIVYIHGGANTSGSGGNEVYTGEHLAQQGVVYVTLNYRVGIFGFLAYEDATGAEVTGNFAIMDQIAALRWVQENIAAFGGDPDNVTIAGQSAGSRNVQTLISSPAAAGLFHRAVAMSANGIDSPVSTLVHVKSAASAALDGLTLEELRAMTAQEVQALTARYNPSSTVIDGTVITAPLTDAYTSGTANPVDLMIGNVDGDAVLFNILRLPDDNDDSFDLVRSVSPEDYTRAVTEQLGEHFLDLYPVYPTAENVIDTARELQADGMITQALRQAEVRSGQYGDHATLVYQFSHVVPDTPEREAAYGAFHTGDVGYWVKHFSKAWDRPWTDVDYALGSEMSARLVEFATSGEVKDWPAHEGAGDTRHLHVTDSVGIAELDPAKAAAWAEHWTP